MERIRGPHGSDTQNQNRKTGSTRPKPTKWSTKIISFEQIRRRYVFMAATIYPEELGMSLIPIRKGTKKPLIEWKKYQTEKPTLEDLKKWFKKFPDTQFAVPTGKLSNLLVMDFDSPDAYRIFKSQYGKLPKTICQKTGRGFHLFFQHAPSFKGRKIGIDDVHVKTEGGYIMMSPSLHESGKMYELNIPWTEIEKKFKSLPKLPANIISLFPKKSTSKAKKEPVTLKPVQRGMRNTTLTCLAGRLIGKGLSKEEVMFFADNWNRRLPEPMEQAEVEGVVSSICKKDARNHPEKINSGTEIIRFTAAELLETPFPEPKWAVQGILPEGFNALGGVPKLGKSMWALNLALAIAYGGKAMNKIDVEQGSVVFLALEDTGRRVKTRIQQMIARNIQARPFFYPLSSLPMFEERRVNKISYAIYNRGINLPNYYELTCDDIRYVCEQLRDIIS